MIPRLRCPLVPHLTVLVTASLVAQGAEAMAVTANLAASGARNRPEGPPDGAGKGRLPAVGASAAGGSQAEASPPLAGEEALRVLESVALVYVSGRNDFDAVLREAILQYVPMGGLFKLHGKQSDNFLQALVHAVGAFPNASWYYIADDDSFVHLERFASFVSSLDASQNLYVGLADCQGLECGSHDVPCRQRHMEGRSNPGWACGGPGVLVSRPLAEAMVRGRCQEYYGRDPAPLPQGDIAFACCAYDVWEGYKVHHAPGFYRFAAPDDFKRDKAIVAVHWTIPETTRRLGRLYNSHLART